MKPRLETTIKNIYTIAKPKQTKILQTIETLYFIYRLVKVKLCGEAEVTALGRGGVES